VVYALTDGGYSDDAELAFIQCFLQDNRLQALLRVSVTEMHFGEWPEGRGEQLAVTPVPRTSSGPMRQLKLDVCALSASSNSYESLQQSKCY